MNNSRALPQTEKEEEDLSLIPLSHMLVISLALLKEQPENKVGRKTIWQT